MLFTVTCCLFNFPGQLLAQQSEIKGTVFNDRGEPIAGVAVIDEATGYGVTTNQDGMFTITASGTSSLIFTYLGMESVTEPISGRTNLTITMSEMATAIDNVIVTALGIKRQEKSLGYAVEKVDGDLLQTVKGFDVASSLTGKVAGMLVNNQSDFGEAPVIKIRGEEPLLVIDGVPYSNMTMRDLAADDIESIEVLKGPTASALYGYRGANGALMVTTKRGAEGSGLSVSFNSSTMFNSGFVAIPKQQSTYGRGTDNTYSRNADRVWGELMEGQILEQWNPITKQLEEMPYLPVGKNNFKNFLETGYVLNNNISIAHEGEKGSIRGSVTWVDTKGQYPNLKYDKYTYNLSGDIRLNKFTFSSGFTYNKHHAPNAGFNNYTSYDPMYSLLIWSGTDWDVRDYKNNYWLVKDEVQNNTYSSGSLDNPYFYMNERIREINRDVMNTFALLSYDIAPWLQASFRSGLDFYVDRQDVRISKGSYSSTGDGYGWENAGVGMYSTERNTGYSMNTDFLLTGDYRWGDFTVDGLVGGTIFYVKDETMYGQTKGGLSIPGYYSLKASVNSAEVTSTIRERQVNSVYGRIAGSWRDMIFAEATLRNDWSSTLPKSTRSYLYPSVSGSFLPSEVLPKTTWLSFWKLRGSWTVSKTPAGIYDTNVAYNVTNSSWGSLTSASLPTSIRGTEVHPETSSTFEVGSMASFFNNRFSVDVTYYEKRMYDFLKSASISSATGYTSNYINIDEERTTRGWELSLSGTPIKTKDWRWDIDVNWSKYATYYTKIDEEFSTDALWVAKGKRVDHYILNDFQRTDTGELIHDNSGLPLFNSFTSLYGYTNPDWLWGIRSTVKYKRFTFSIAFDGRVGGLTPSVTEAYLWIAGSHPNSVTYERYLDVTQGGANHLSQGVRVRVNANGEPIGSVEYDTYGRVISDTRQFEANDTYTTYKDYIARIHKNYIWGGYPSPLDVLKTTFTKIRDISLTYDLPKDFCAKFGCKGASVSFVGQNVALWAKEFKYSDPDGGVENFADPSSRYLGFNIKLKF